MRAEYTVINQRGLAGLVFSLRGGHLMPESERPQCRTLSSLRQTEVSGPICILHNSFLCVLEIVVELELVDIIGVLPS